jgi:hypothetical protein
MPQSNKRTAGLPNPHPIGLPGSLPLGPSQAPAQHQIQTLPGSPPLWPCHTPDQHWIHTPRGSQPLRPHQIHTPLGSPPFRSYIPQALLGPSSAWDYWIHAPPEFPPLGPWAPVPPQIHTLRGSMPLVPLPLKPCWAPAPCRTIRATLH